MLNMGVDLAKRKSQVAIKYENGDIAYHIRAENTTYNDLGRNSPEKRDTEAIKRCHLKQLEKFGYAVTLTLNEPTG
jgi:hypothetical protein